MTIRMVCESYFARPHVYVFIPIDFGTSLEGIYVLLAMWPEDQDCKYDATFGTHFNNKIGWSCDPLHRDSMGACNSIVIRVNGVG